jgi:GntR family transcriptional regulator / MocR family aminotransferase
MHDFQANVLLELTGPGPLHARLAQALREAIRASRLPPGSVLPPSRVLAAELGCSRWVVTEAYAQLATAGYVDSRVGSGTRVRPRDATSMPARRPEPRPPAAAQIDMAPGLPDLRAFPVGRWAAAIRSAAAALSAADLGHPDPAGHPALRGLLGEYLARVRGAQAAAADLTICAGATDGIGRLCRALRRAGAQAVAVEDPGWHRIRDVAATAGLAIVPVPVDAEGIQAACLSDRPEVGAVIVSPAHQFPTGVVLSAARRAALLDWARRTGGLIIEDDYDAEFRYDGRPAGTVQGAGPAHVALLGSVSKTLSPALGIGWLITPPAWTAAVRNPLAAAPPPPVLDQLAFAAFLRAGSYDRHLRAARRRYRTRRDMLVTALTERLPQARVSGAAAGLHLLLGLGDGTDPAAVRTTALSRGVRVADLSTYRADHTGGGPGLVLGYGNLADHQIADAVALLAQSMAR